MDEYKKLVWKHFFKQKWNEIWGFIKEVSPFLCGVLIVFSFISQMGWGTEGQEIYAKIGLCVLIIFAMVGIFFMIQSIYKWLKSNWKLAKENAYTELNVKNIKKTEEKEDGKF